MQQSESRCSTRFFALPAFPEIKLFFFIFEIMTCYKEIETLVIGVMFI